MHRLPITSADWAVLRNAHASAKAQEPAEPRASLPEQRRPFWGLLAQKLGALLAEHPSGDLGLTLAERNARREV
jgi:hypothetical protein